MDVNDVTLGEVYRLVTHISSRLDQLDYISSAVYHANRAADREDLKDLQVRMDRLEGAAKESSRSRVSEHRFLITTVVALLACSLSFVGQVAAYFIN